MTHWTNWGVIESRHNKSQKFIRRRRKSESGQRITTVEIDMRVYKHLLDKYEKYRNLKNLIRSIVREAE